MASNRNYIPQALTKEQSDRYDKVMALETGNGGWTNKALRSLGINTPPTTGWRRRFVLNGPDYEPIEDPQTTLIDLL